MGRNRSVAVGQFAGAALALLLLPRVARCQYQPPSDFLNIQCDGASTWSEAGSNAIEITGPVVIQTDRSKMTANSAVVWITPVPGSVLDEVRAEIALIGNASLEQPQVNRTGDQLYVTTEVRGSVRLSTPQPNQRIAQNLAETDLYKTAFALRPLSYIPEQQRPIATDFAAQHPWMTPPPSTEPTTAPTTQTTKVFDTIAVHADQTETVETAEGKVAAILTGNVQLFQNRASGDFVEMQAERAVLFTTLTSLKDTSSADKMKKVEDTVIGAYMEGDVRINFLPKAGGNHAEQRMRSNRVYYDFTTDRAALTDVVVHAVEPLTNTPIIIRANNMRQLSMGEYRANHAEVTTSSFANPSYSIKSDRAYIREEDTGDPQLGVRTIFDARSNTFNVFGLPTFYWPVAAGSMTQKGFPLRQIMLGSGTGVGTGIRTTWGFFESIGVPPPPDLDIDYRLDYFTERGPAGGVDATYGGSIITENTKQPWDFSGDLKSYLVEDHGTDRLGRYRRVEPEDETRYHIEWQHQHFFPDNWQLQLRASAVSDPSFLPQWFPSEFNNGLPHDESAYLKHQDNTEAFTIFGNIQPNNFVTTAEMLQEQFEVERLPELGYYRVGDSIFDDTMTFYSENTVSGLHFRRSDDELDRFGFSHRRLDPGLPSTGRTGFTDDTVYRGDFRQEVDYPFQVGQFKFEPYAFVRLTPYSETPEDGGILDPTSTGPVDAGDGGADARVMVGTGARVSTAFWKVDDTAENDLFDIHRLRHVIEPQLNVFTSAEHLDRNDVYQYDEAVDQVNDVTAAQLALNQRWQTKRGGPGQWRSVDFLTLNVEANFFANQPDEQTLRPKGFRGLYYPTAPEESIPRNSLNTDALWRVSDTTAILADESYNLDESELATTSIGATIQRDTRMAYFLGVRYIGQVNSTIASFIASYQISAKYSVRLAESVDLDQNKNQDTSITLVRKFDRFFITGTVFYDAVDDTNGFRVGIFPEGLGYGLNTDQFQNAFGRE